MAGFGGLSPDSRFALPGLKKSPAIAGLGGIPYVVCVMFTRFALKPFRLYGSCRESASESGQPGSP